MRSAPKLTLKKETLAELSTGELTSVAGGTTGTVVSRLVDVCPTHDPRICPTTVSRIIDPCLTDFCTTV